MDERVHVLAVGQIDSFGLMTDVDCPVKIVFSGLTLTVRVPKQLLLDNAGVRRFVEDEYVRIDGLLEEFSSIKSYDKNQYVASALRVKKILAFDKVKG